ncbi:MAG: M28 family peptidase, partial [Vicinamibacterales bacterium]
MRPRRYLVPTFVLVIATVLSAQPASKGGIHSIQPDALKEWLGYIASDDLQGRQIYTEGLGLAAAYIADHLKAWGVKPAGDHGSYFQTVKVVGVKSASRATVTVDVNGQSKTFKDGQGVAFAKNMGARQTITGDQIEFVGYGLQIPAANVDDYAKTDPKGTIVVWLGANGPSTIGPESRRLLTARTRLATDKGAIAVIAPASGFGLGRGAAAPAPAPTPAATAAGAVPAAPAGPTPSAQAGTAVTLPDAGRGQAPAGGGGRGGVADPADFTTVQRYDLPVAPVVTAQDEFFEFLFSGSETTYAALKEAATKGEPIAPFTLKHVTITVNVEADYTVVSTRLTRNVVGIIEGSDARLKDTYVLFGAHYDHVGYSPTPPGAGRGGGVNAGGCTGQTRDTPRPGDVINNGADDDGSGTVAVMAVARAYALGPRPKRSLMFVWHSGEESGLYGSRYMVDYPVVPLDTISAQLNIDMIGRNRCDQASEANTVYLVGSDRISTELHNVSEATNAKLPTPLRLDYELNDPADPESIYTRSDHYSYASKGIPIVFYTTGLHKDYHYVTDEVSKIEFPKMAHIAQLVYETGWNLA